MKLKKIWAGMAVAAVSVSGFVGVGIANAAPPEPTETNAIDDYGLKKFLNTEYFGNPADTNITAEQLETLTEIDIANSEKQISQYVDSSPGYVNISGLRYATNLKKIDFNKENDDDTVVDFNNFDLTDRDEEESANYFWNELNMIKSLEELDISRTQIEDPNNGTILDLPNLTTITAMENRLSNLDYLSNLPNLTNLNLRNNSIMDSLAFLEGSPNLVKLDLAGNYGYTWDSDAEGTEQALSQLDKLKSLDISYNSFNSFDENDGLIDAIMDMDSLEWFNFEGNSTRDLRPWKPVADKVDQTSFANQQLSSYSRRDNESDGSTRYDLNFYDGTYSYDKVYDVDGVEYTLKDNGGLLYDYIDGHFFTSIRTEIPTGVITGDRTNSGSGQSYNIDELKEINSEGWFSYGFGNETTRGSFGFQHNHAIGNHIGVLPQEQYIDVEVGESVQTEELTVINSDATATYSTFDELPEGLTLNSETGVISGTTEEGFNGIIEIIPEFSESVSYNGQITIDFNIGEGAIVITEPVVISDLPNGKVGEEYNGLIITDSGTIIIVAGLPEGLTYDYDTGEVSGVPTEDGEFEVFVEIEKDGEYYDSIERLTVDPADAVVEPVIQTNLPDGQVGVDYEGSVIVENGEITNTTGLPDGLTINFETGDVSGIPTTDGEFDVVITAENSDSETIVDQTILINPVDEEPVVETPVNNSNLPDGKVDENYEGYIIVEPGEITEVVGLPDGLTFNPENGVVDGVPTKDGEFEVSITAENEDIEIVFTEIIIIEAADVETPVDEDDTTLPDDSDDTVIDEEEEKEQIVPNDDEVPNTDDVKPVNKVDKKVESGELSDNTSSPILYILSLIAGFGILSSIGLIRLKNKNN